MLFSVDKIEWNLSENYTYNFNRPFNLSNRSKLIQFFFIFETSKWSKSAYCTVKKNEKNVCAPRKNLLLTPTL